MERFVLSIDQGTTGTTVLVFDHAATIRGKAYAEFPQIYPQPGWVEHDANRIWSDCRRLLFEAVENAQISWTQVAAIGITNQRETIVCWDKRTGKPLGHAIVWQDRRTAKFCGTLKEQGLEPHFQRQTGLLLDPYFSGTKLKWILDQDAGIRGRAANGEILAGTVDSWLIWNLTGGKEHVTDVTNASRTLLYNIHNVDWDDDLLRILDVPRAMLPRVVSSSGMIGMTEPTLFRGSSIPLSGIAGDQQAALFGQACFSPGRVKNTYGTGSFLLMHTGTTPPLSTQRLLTTIACRVGSEPVEYALEGAVFIAGAAVQWLRDGLGIIQSAHETEALASSLNDNDGVYFVPALTGLGAPYWDPYARGLLIGITRGTTRAHLARATLEAICYQTRDVVDAMVRDAGLGLTELRADGGAVENQFLMQFQADTLGVPVRIPAVVETTALGAAYLAGLGIGFWNSRSDIESQWQAATSYMPHPKAAARNNYGRWLQAVEKSKGWVKSS